MLVGSNRSAGNAGAVRIRNAIMFGAIMSLNAQFIDPEIFTVDGVLTPQECEALISRAEEIGFVAASVRTRSGQQMMTNIRNNDRVNVTDEELSGMMWERIAGVLPDFDNQRPIRVDPRLRFYRYLPNQEFKRHKDGSVTSADGLVSKLSYLIYLNSEFEGGSTNFREYVDEGEKRAKIEHPIAPKTGMALLFRHHRWHEGAPLISGCKYVLRSDVFYGPYKGTV